MFKNCKHTRELNDYCQKNNITLQYMRAQYGQYMVCECKEDDNDEEEEEQINQQTNEEQYNKLVNLDDEELKNLEPFLTFLRKKNIDVRQEYNRLNLQLEVIHCYKELLKTRIRQTDLKKENECYQIMKAIPSNSKMYGEISKAVHKKTPFELTVKEFKDKMLI